MAQRRPRVLLVSMYPLRGERSGPVVRIAHLRDELAKLVDLDVVDGYRGERRAKLARYALSGRMRGLDGIYVESSTFLPAEADVAFLALARALRIRSVTYIRDAYQLFDEYYDADSLRRWLGQRAFRPAFSALAAVSSEVAFPTRGLATIVVGDRGTSAPLLPPGSPPPLRVPRASDANRILYVGDLRLRAQGAELLIDAMRVARRRAAELELAVVTRPGDEPPGPHPAWLTIHRATGSEIRALLPRVLATVVPRPRNRYNDVALPLKLMEYLSYARPLVVTDCIEQARVVTEARCGVVAEATPEELGDAIARVAGSPPATLDRWSRAAASAARRASWAQRARTVLELLQVEVSSPAGRPRAAPTAPASRTAPPRRDGRSRRAGPRAPRP